MPKRDRGTDALTLPQGFVVAILIGAVSWFASTVTDMYREGGSTSRALDDNKRFMEQRNRENDDIKALDLILLQNALNNCYPHKDGGTEQ